MKPVFPRSSQAFALVLAVSLTISANGLAHADLMNKVNPMNWFAGNSQPVQQVESTSKAQKRATEAQAQAEQALKAAQEALQKAEQIKKQADELQMQAQQQAQPSKTAKQGKPVVKAPRETLQETAPAEQTAAFEQPEKQTTAASSTESSESSEKNGWYTLKLFKKTNTNAESTQEADVPVSDTQSASAQTARNTPTAPANADTQPPASKETTSAPWNPMTWFAKPTSDNATANLSQETPPVEEKAAPAKSGEVSLKTKAAVMETERGNITFELYPDYAPVTVNNFAKLIGDGFYNRFNMKFHRVVPGFVIQTGDPTGTGAGGSKERIPLESKNKLSHNAKGIVAMARGADPNSATSQFYITLAPQTSLDGKYTIFGKVIAGMDVLEKIEKDDMLYGIRLVDLESVVRDPSPDKKRFFSSVF